LFVVEKIGASWHKELVT